MHHPGLSVSFCYPYSAFPRHLFGVGLLFALIVACSAQEPKKPAEPAKGGAFRLPDGTVVLFTKNPDEPNPKVDGVLLSPKEYQTLLDQADLGKKAKDATKPVSPSACHVRGKIEKRNERQVAVLTIAYSFRTTVPNAQVLLGCQRAFPVAATMGDGKLAVLEISPDGLAVLVERPGEYTLTLNADAPIAARTAKAELGFEIGLPRAAITTLSFESPSPEVKKLIVGTRTPDAATPLRIVEPKRTTDDIARYAAKPDGTGSPLGPIDSLEVAWDAPGATTPIAPSISTAEADIAVRIDDGQIETTAKFRIRGATRDWAFAFPKDADVTATRAVVDPASVATATVVRPTDPKLPLWKIQLPDALGEWVIASVVRAARPDPKDGKFAGPYTVGPFAVPTAVRQSGMIRFYAPPNVRLSGFKHGPELRPFDVPAGAEDPPTAAFRYTALPNTSDKKPPANIEFEARPARGIVTVQPHYKLTLTPTGWLLRCEARISPVRTVVEQVTIELPAGWLAPVVQPLELVDEVQGGGELAGKRTLVVRLAAGQKDPFAIILETRFPVQPTDQDVSLLLPRMLLVGERDAQVTVTVPDSLEVRGSVREWDGNQPSAVALDLKPTTAQGVKSAPGSAQLTGQFDAGISRLDLAWQPYRQELSAEVRAEVSVWDRQLDITETIRFKSLEPIRRPIRLKGPRSPTAFRPQPAIEPLGAGEWVFAPAAGVKEATLVVRYSVPVSGNTASVPLLWPDATKIEATTRVWGGVVSGGRRATKFEGPWQELAPEPDADREAMPWLTLSGTGNSLPLTLELGESRDAASGAIIERGVVQAWAGDDGAILARCRFVLRRWTAATTEIEVASTTPPVAFVDRERIDTATPIFEEGSAKRYRIVLPVPKANRPYQVVEVRYAAAPGRNDREVTIPAPSIRGATLRTPIRWHVTVSANAVPLLLNDGVSAEFRWLWRGWLLAPTATTTTADLDRWIADGSDPDAKPDFTDTWAEPSGESVAARQPTLAAITVYRVPRNPWVIGCSLLAILLGVGLSRLRPMLLGPAVALLGFGLATAAVYAPQPTAQVGSAAIPGALIVAGALGVQSFLQWRSRRRISHLSAFHRGGSNSASAPVLVPSPSAPRASRNGNPSGAAGTVPPLATPTAN